MRAEQSYINKPFQPVLKDHRLQLSASRPWPGRSKKKWGRKKKKDNILLYKKTFKACFPIYPASG